MVKKIWKDQFELLETGVISREDVDGAVDMIVLDKIDPQVFVSNLEVLIQGYSSPLNFAASGVESKEPSPSVHHSDITRRAPAFPLWFYAAYPDVMKWFDEWQKKCMQTVDFDLDKLATETTKLFGLKAEDIENTNNSVLNNEKQYRPNYLKNLVQKYKEKTGKELEVMVGEYSESDIYTGQEMLNAVDTESNFTLIAETTTKFYLELKKNYSEYFNDEVTLLATAGILDAQWYVFSGNIQPKEILDIAKNSEQSKDSLLDFITKLEVILLGNDTPNMTTKDIEKAVEEQKNNIGKAIQKIRKEYRSEHRIASDIKTFMESDKLQEVRNSIGIKERNKKTDNKVNVVLFIFFFLAISYFILIETWFWPIKILIFLIMVFVLKKFFFPKK